MEPFDGVPETKINAAYAYANTLDYLENPGDTSRPEPLAGYEKDDLNTPWYTKAANKITAPVSNAFDSFLSSLKKWSLIALVVAAGLLFAYFFIKTKAEGLAK